MNLDPQDHFTLYVRRDPKHGHAPDDLERPLASCSTYEDARRHLQGLGLRRHHCIIRFEGHSGGSD